MPEEIENLEGESEVSALVQKTLDGQRLALSRLITQVENGTATGIAALEELYAHTGHAHLIGVTGAPGTGKSSLVNHLALSFRKPKSGEPLLVAIVAVDPTSPFSGGAILGDRVRMRDLAGDPGVFIRSMASRGSLGGLASATSGVVLALDAAGFDVIIVETVGAGQAEVDIARLAHTTIVVEAPGLGDEIQAIKAGILEIADIIVINKADKPGIEMTESALRSMLQMANPRNSFLKGKVNHYNKDDRKFDNDNCNDVMDVDPWKPEIQKTIATSGQGVSELRKLIGLHYEYLVRTNELEYKENTRLRFELDNLLQETLISRWRESVSEDEYNNILSRLVMRKISPWQAVEHLIIGDER